MSKKSSAKVANKEEPERANGSFLLNRKEFLKGEFIQ